MAAQEHLHEVIIREQHLDAYGHVNNAAYMVLFEEARWEWITPNGFGAKRVQEIQYGPVLLEATIRFKREIKLREKIRISTILKEQKGLLSYIFQEMIKEDGQIGAEGTFVLALFDLKARKLMKPTPEWKHALGLE
jgi:acyl-CoA thioester hydrolase